MRSLLLAALMVFIGLPGIALAQVEPVAIFKNVSGDVNVIRNQAWMAAAPGMALMRSDVVTSGPGGSGGIAFKDGTLLTLGESSEVEIRHYVFRPREAKYGFDVFLKKGTAIYASGKIGKLAPESVKLDTPRAAVGVRGTRFILQAGE